MKYRKYKIFMNFTEILLNQRRKVGIIDTKNGVILCSSMKA